MVHTLLGEQLTQAVRLAFQLVTHLSAGADKGNLCGLILVHLDAHFQPSQLSRMQLNFGRLEILTGQPHHLVDHRFTHARMPDLQGLARHLRQTLRRIALLVDCLSQHIELASKGLGPNIALPVTRTALVVHCAEQLALQPLKRYLFARFSIAGDRHHGIIQALIGIVRPLGS